MNEISQLDDRNRMGKGLKAFQGAKINSRKQITTVVLWTNLHSRQNAKPNKNRNVQIKLYKFMYIFLYSSGSSTGFVQH